MTEILMPALSDSMEQGLILQWLAADGAEIAAGDELCEIETDKATMTYEAEAGGTLTIVAAEGSTVAVGEPIASLGEASEVPSTPTLGASSGDRTAEAPRATGNANGNGNAPGTDTAVATPVARRLAAVHGVALEALSGSGPRGRIVKSDVIDAAGLEAPPAASRPQPPAASRPQPPAASRPQPAVASRARPATAAPRQPTQPTQPAQPAQPASNGSGRTEDLSRLQQLIARRMSEATATVPHFQVQTEVAFDAALTLRAQLKEQLDPAPSVNDLIVKASALALRDHPRANGSYRDGRFALHDRVNVGVAVATQDALVVPVVFDADTKPLGAIAADTRALAAKVREGTVTPAELSGATFTVSNLGMFGMTAISPVIDPPQAAILGVGAARSVLARDPETGAIVDRRLLTLTLSCDHRILYGADAARFLSDIRALLEAPLRLGFSA